MSSIHFTSDLHLGHQMVSELRGFSSPEVHDQVLADNWDEVVGNDDIVYVLGDITLKNPKTVVRWVQERRGRKRLIAGNHDPVHPMHRNWRKYRETYDAMFESVSTGERIRMMGSDYLLSHFPYVGRGEGERELEERHTQWRLPDMGGWLLHGHTHSSRTLTYDTNGKTLRMVHVGLDAHRLRPVSQVEVMLAVETIASEETYLDERDERHYAGRHRG